MKNFKQRVAVIGASGGIGAAFVDLLASDGRVGKIFALSRSGARHSDPKVLSHPIDLEDEASVAAAANFACADGTLDQVIVASGILHRGKGLSPEKSLRDLDAGSMSEVFAVNTIGPALIAKYFLPRLARGRRTVFAALSARVGSIGDNRLGGWYSYRASKAALNMVIKTLAIEHARRFKESLVVALHPGTVATPLSEPFSSRVPNDQLFSPARAAEQLLGVLENLDPEDSGGFFAWDGARVEF